MAGPICGSCGRVGHYTRRVAESVREPPPPPRRGNCRVCNSPDHWTDQGLCGKSLGGPMSTPEQQRQQQQSILHSPGKRVKPTFELEPENPGRQRVNSTTKQSTSSTNQGHRCKFANRQRHLHQPSSSNSVDNHQQIECQGNNISTEIYSHKINALLDAGAQSSFICSSFLKSLGDSNTKKIKPSNLQCVLADKSEVVRKVKISLPTYVKGTKYNVEFNILDHLNYPVIIGFDFLQRYGAILKVSDQGIQVALSTIPVYMQKVIFKFQLFLCPEALYFNAKLKEGEVGECSECTHLNDKPLLTARTAVTVHNHTVPIRLMNPTDHTQSTACGESITTFKRLSESHYQPYVQTTSTASNSVPTHSLTNIETIATSKPTHLDFDLILQINRHYAGNRTTKPTNKGILRCFCRSKNRTFRSHQISST